MPVEKRPLFGHSVVVGGGILNLGVSKESVVLTFLAKKLSSWFTFAEENPQTGKTQLIPKPTYVTATGQ